MVTTKPNIRRAIERSRRARGKLARRRRRWAIAASVCIAAGVPLSFSAMGVTGSDMARAAENGAQSLAELLDRRSPGAREVAQLTKTKKARALAKVRQAAPAAPVAPAPSELAKALLPPAQLPVELGSPAVLLQAGSPPLSAFVGPPGVLVGAPGGTSGGPGGSPGGPGGPGGSPGGGGPALVTTQPTTVTSAVPEPGTWATMLLGFGLLGWRFRVRRDALHKLETA